MSRIAETPSTLLALARSRPGASVAHPAHPDKILLLGRRSRQQYLAGIGLRERSAHRLGALALLDVMDQRDQLGAMSHGERTADREEARRGIGRDGFAGGAALFMLA